MGDQMIPVPLPSRKVNWSQSQESHCNSEAVVDPRNLKGSKINLLSNSLDSKLEEFAQKNQEFYDVDEDGRPLLPREHLSQNETQQHSLLHCLNTRDSVLSTWQKETESSKHFLKSIWQKCESKNLGSRKQIEHHSCSLSFDSCGPSNMNIEGKVTFTESDTAKQAVVNREISGNSMFMVQVTVRTVNADNEINNSGNMIYKGLHNNDNKEHNTHSTAITSTLLTRQDGKSISNIQIASSFREISSVDRENGWHQSSLEMQYNKTTVDENEVKDTEVNLGDCPSIDADDFQQSDCLLPDFSPEMPPSPPRSESDYSTGIRNLKLWNADHLVKAKSNKPQVINLTVLCGNRQSVSHAEFSSRSQKQTQSNKELYKEHKYDLEFDADDEKAHVWHNNHAYDQMQQDRNWDSTFDNSYHSSDNNAYHAHNGSGNEKGHQISNSRAKDETEISVPQESQQEYLKSNNVSKNTLNNEVMNSNNFVKIENRPDFLPTSSFSSSINQQRIQAHPGSLSAENHLGGSNELQRDTVQGIRTHLPPSIPSGEFGFPENFGHQDWVNSSQNDTNINLSNSSENVWYTNTNRNDEESCTFEKTNESWLTQTDPAERSQYDPYNSGFEYNQNSILDEIQNFPVSSKTLSIPHPHGQQEDSSQNSMYYGHRAENTFDAEHWDREHIHEITSQTNSYDNAGTQHNDGQHPTESFVSGQRGHSRCSECGNCCNCKGMEMMDTMKALAQSAGFIIHDVLPDGNCMFRSTVDQLRMHGVLDTTASDLRSRAVEYLTNNPCSEDGTHMKDFLLTETWEQYLERMKKDGEWGDEITLKGISEVLQRKICIISAVGKHHNQITIHPSSIETDQSEDLFLGHLNDSHYLSLRPSDWLDKWFVNARKVKELKRKKSVNATGDMSDVGRTTVGIEKLLISNKEMEDQLLYQEKLIDDLSMTPLPHLSYVMRNVINFKFLVPANVDADLNLEGAIAVGIHAEKLEIILFDPLSARSSPQKGKITSPSVLLEMPNYLVVKGKRVENNRMNCLFIDEENIHPGFLRLHPASHSHFNKGTLEENLLIMQSNLTRENEQPKLHSFYNQNEESPNVTYCFRCRSWPDSAMEFQHRKRLSGWPAQQHIEQAMNQGCLVIAEAHPQSSKPEVEFMYLFAEAEKIIACSFEKYQKYCFHVFRLIVKLVTKGIPLLCTYHIKTIFFYASEVLPRRYWELNPGACFLYLISRLLSCLHCKVLPHYFIKENNLIDCFDDVSLSKLKERIGSVRDFPITALTLLAEAHGLSSSWMADAIIKDTKHFLIYQDLQRSLCKVFVPTSLKIVESFARYNMYNDAAEVVQENYNNAKTLSVAYKINPVESLFHFIQPVLTQLNIYQKWWLCFLIDMKCEEKTLPLLTENEEGRTIADIVGEKNKGELAHVFVPYQVLSQQTCPHACSVTEDSSDFEINFLVYLTFYLNATEKYEVCSHYQRYLVQLIKEKIEANASLPAIIEKHDDSRLRKQRKENNHGKITFLYQQLYHTLIHLFHSYNHVGQPELFQEFIHDLEYICDTIATTSAYQNLSNIWEMLGSHEMAKLASAKKRNLTH